MGRISSRVKLFSLFAAAAAVLVMGLGTAWPQGSAKPGSAAASLKTLKTRAETTNYAETSRYQDVIDFMKAVAAASPRVHLTTYGYTFEGRPLPLAVIGAGDASPEAVKATGKTRIYIQGNIHAGEVEGKEACLEILRAIALGEHSAWFDSVVLLINPIYNADGNERVNLTNRQSQNGPVGGMGQRPNAQGYDLNRDFIKVDAPESRTFALMMSTYDPHIAVDLHTTDGTAHAYYLTYAPPLHPATSSSITDLLRNDLLPAVTRAIKAKDGWNYYFFGDVRSPGGRGGMGGRGGGTGGRGGGRGGAAAGGRGEAPTPPAAPVERSWYTTEPTGRYSANYVGLRNRMGILSETFAWLTFQERIAAARRFVEEIITYGSQHGAEIRKATADADSQSIVGQEIGLRGRAVKSAEQVEILLGELTTERNPYTGGTMRRRLAVSNPEMMYQYISFEASESTIAPRAYFVPANLRYAQDRLQAHGVSFRKLEQDLTVKGEQFRIESSELSEREYEGHKARTITGKWEPADLNVPAGTLVVPVDQPLGRLILMLLEPRSEDSLSAWGLLDDVLERMKPEVFPITRTSEAVPGAR